MAQLFLHRCHIAGPFHDPLPHGMTGTVGGLAFYPCLTTHLVPDVVYHPGIEATMRPDYRRGREKEGRGVPFLVIEGAFMFNIILYCL